MKNNNTNFCYTLYKPDVHGVCKTVFLPSNLISGENINSIFGYTLFQISKVHF